MEKYFSQFHNKENNIDPKQINTTQINYSSDDMQPNSNQNSNDIEHFYGYSSKIVNLICHFNESQT